MKTLNFAFSLLCGIIQRTAKRKKKKERKQKGRELLKHILGRMTKKDAISFRPGGVQKKLSLTFYFVRGKDGVRKDYMCVGIPHGLATEEGTVITWIASSEMGVILHAINA